jgi:hypothetical protein
VERRVKCSLQSKSFDTKLDVLNKHRDGLLGQPEDDELVKSLAQQILVR